MAKGICTVDGCDVEQVAHGWCRRHYMQARNRGLLPPRPTPEQRFWRKVEKTETCWLWIGSKTPEGYGKFKVGGRYTYVHRFAYELLVGPIPARLEVDHLHTCPRHCVNPTHLRLATHTQNNQNLAGARKNSRTGIRGVTWDRQRHMVRAQVRHGSRVHVSHFPFLVLAEQWAIRKRLEVFTHNDADRVRPLTPPDSVPSDQSSWSSSQSWSWSQPQ